MAENYKSRKLIVEGEQDKRVIPELIEAHGISWGQTKQTAIVSIEVYGSDEFIKEAVISTELKASGLQSLGLIIDADNDLKGRWTCIREVCSRIMANFPQNLPESGLIHRLDTGVKFGVWIMPDNKTEGMLETFLSYLIPDEKQSIWLYAQQSTDQARNKGASFIDSHRDKAHIYTWLAWQNPPGRQLHNAVMEKILNPTHAKAKAFIDWFRELYNL